jgi:hypothetical protein
MNVSTPTEPIRAWLENLPAEQKPIIEALRRLIEAVAPEAHENISRDAVWYNPPDSGYPILYITVFQAHVNLGFFYGGFVPDPERLLIGSGKRMRHLKIRSLQETENPAVTHLLTHAWADGVQRVKQLPHRRT